MGGPRHALQASGDCAAGRQRPSPQVRDSSRRPQIQGTGRPGAGDCAGCTPSTKRGGAASAHAGRKAAANTATAAHTNGRDAPEAARPRSTSIASKQPRPERIEGARRRCQSRTVPGASASPCKKDTRQWAARPGARAVSVRGVFEEKRMGLNTAYRIFVYKVSNVSRARDSPMRLHLPSPFDVKQLGYLSAATWYRAARSARAGLPLCGPPKRASSGHLERAAGPGASTVASTIAGPGTPGRPAK